MEQLKPDICKPPSGYRSAHSKFAYKVFALWTRACVSNEGVMPPELAQQSVGPIAIVDHLTPDGAAPNDIVCRDLSGGDDEHFEKRRIASLA
jgi:hypothetical protein